VQPAGKSRMPSGEWGRGRAGRAGLALV
jgi:hypothetical protein